MKEYKDILYIIKYKRKMKIEREIINILSKSEILFSYISKKIKSLSGNFKSHGKNHFKFKNKLNNNTKI
jgi:hypothetical protein